MAKTIVKDVPPGMFVLTKPQKCPADLKEWESFLEGKGIKTAICESSSGGFVLAREGVQARGMD
jgi:hypothetical protein